MFKRLIYDDWLTWIPIASFVVTFSIFILLFIRALRLEQKEVDRMARLPLNHDHGKEHMHHEDKEGPAQ